MGRDKVPQQSPRLRINARRARRLIERRQAFRHQQSPRLRINARRRLASIIGPRISPSTSGPSGTPALPSGKPRIPAANIAQTLTTALFSA
jgi:hypothetical protein